jgi:HTH-type transcriptional regulator, competence development regulator
LDSASGAAGNFLFPEIYETNISGVAPIAAPALVPNAYLSQIENDQIKKPSPNILHALAELYAVSYENLMERAGFVVPTRSRAGAQQRHGRVATFAGHNLTAEEEAELVKYLGYLRTRKK